MNARATIFQPKPSRTKTSELAPSASLLLGTDLPISSTEAGNVSKSEPQPDTASVSCQERSPSRNTLLLGKELLVDPGASEKRLAATTHPAPMSDSSRASSIPRLHEEQTICTAPPHQDSVSGAQPSPGKPSEPEHARSPGDGKASAEGANEKHTVSAAQSAAGSERIETARSTEQQTKSPNRTKARSCRGVGGNLKVA